MLPCNVGCTPLVFPGVKPTFERPQRDDETRKKKTAPGGVTLSCLSRHACTSDLLNLLFCDLPDSPSTVFTGVKELGSTKPSPVSLAVAHHRRWRRTARLCHHVHAHPRHKTPANGIRRGRAHPALVRAEPNLRSPQPREMVSDASSPCSSACEIQPLRTLSRWCLPAWQLAAKPSRPGGPVALGVLS